MDVKAILLIGALPRDYGFDAQFAGGAPLAGLDVLGRRVALRTADRLLASGVSEVLIVGDTATLRAAERNIALLPLDERSLWRGCETAFSEYAQSGADVLLVQHIGPYLELDYDAVVQFHLDEGNRVTPVCDESGAALGVFAVSGSRRNDAAFLFRHQLAELRSPCRGYQFTGHVNPLESAADLRRLTVDAFAGRVQMAPAGREIKPGVWVGEGARVHNEARLLAPAFVGSFARVRASAVVTRFSTVEHHAHVDCGTVVQDANVLPYCYVGAGLDVQHAVVGSRRVAHLKRAVEVEITDPKLVGSIPQQAPLRAIASAASLASFLPAQVLRSLFPSPRREQPASLPAAVQAPSAALRSPAAREAAHEVHPQFHPNLMMARKYGND